jgi:hypothetical protein
METFTSVSVRFLRGSSFGLHDKTFMRHAAHSAQILICYTFRT